MKYPVIARKKVAKRLDDVALVVEELVAKKLVEVLFVEMRLVVDALTAKRLVVVADVTTVVEARRVPSKVTVSTAER